jgi:tRNA(Arg) A34 adenosine deaminase TadA
MSSSTSEGVVIDATKQQPPLTATPAEIKRMLQCMQDEILPITTDSVTNKGNKVFGAAVLDADLKTVLADTNTETTCPLFHGEIKVIYEWAKITPAPQRGPAAQSSIFLATHEPCCMCISSIVWSGFKKVFYFFPYAVTSAQGIPHDINTMHELWGVNTYRKTNKYCATACLMDMIAEMEEGPEKTELLAMQQTLLDDYDKLSNKYHSEKDSNENNSLVLG